ncbi:MAG: radical SAM protein [Polyangiaceae bacterium]|nr:radical SAM protein [Polyangiaceae bacterium]
MQADPTGVPGETSKIAAHEDAAHEKRNWVRLTFDCNDHCVFCLDALAHDGTMRDGGEVRRQILDGRRKGATRLILSGGEPTIHPSFVEFVRLGALAGYPKIQTVTNGRMFAYASFLRRCIDAGLGEITFSLHGPNARIHDALVGTRGAFDEEMAGLSAALADGRPIVNVDIVVNRANVKHLGEMLRMLTEMGVREFDLLQVVPFGRAFTEGRSTLFYDLAEMRPHILEALAYSKRPDIHIWMNRFPPEHLETYEHLIQDPYKLNDEVRGRKEEFARLLERGLWLDCREPERCRHCYLQRLCDALEVELSHDEARDFEIVRVDTAWEATQPPVFGGDPASARRAHDRPALTQGFKRRLPLAMVPRQGTTLDELVLGSRATTLHVVAPNIDDAAAPIARFPHLRRLELRLEDYSGLERALDEAKAGSGPFSGRTLLRAEAASVAAARALLAIDTPFEVCVDLTRETAPWLGGLDAFSTRLSLRQPAYERSTESAKNDADLGSFFAHLPAHVPVEGVPACLLGRSPRARPPALDTAMRGPDGRLEIFRYTRRYILSGYRTKSLRCATCRENARCEGVHINFVRAHGYGALKPLV